MELQDLVDTGFKLIPLEQGSKKPLERGYASKAYTLGDLTGNNVGLIIERGKVDIDYDWPEASSVKPYLIKPSILEFGRAGRLTHTIVQSDLEQPVYNLSDDQVEHQIRDRLSFMRFLGLGLEGRVPDAKTVWLYREQLTQAGVIEALFETFDGYLKDQGYLAMGGQIIDASIVAVPKQRNSREENARIKAGETPAGWEDKPAKRRQKDVEARWTKKHGKSHYGYKNHVNVDRRHKLVQAAERGGPPLDRRPSNDGARTPHNA